jgi:hypothetical protein
MKRKLKPYYFLSILILFFSCEEITDWNLKTGQNKILVVDAIITDEFKNQEILLSLSFDGMNDYPEPARGAKIIIKEGNEIFHFSEDQEHPGHYKSDKEFSAVLNKDYELEISWNNNDYHAENNMVQSIPFTPVTFKPVSGTDSLTFDQTPPLYSPQEQAMYEITVDWSDIISSEKTRAKVIYYTFNTIDVNEIFKPAKQSVLFPKGSKVIEKKYSLNSKTANYFRSVLMETEWQGAAFDEASAPVSGNISNGGLGYFCVCSVLSDTIIAR